MLQYELHSNSLHIFGITAHPNQCATTKIQVLLNQTSHKTIHEETGTKPSKRTVSDHRAAGTNLTSVFPPAFVNFSKRTLSHQLYHMIIFHPHPADFKIKFRDKIGREEGALECSLMTPQVHPCHSIVSDTQIILNYVFQDSQFICLLLSSQIPSHTSPNALFCLHTHIQLHITQCACNT